MPPQKHTIDPDGWYSENAVVLLLGVGLETQAMERKAGRLGFTDAGGVRVYRGQDLLDWLESSGSGAESKTETEAARGRGGSRPRSAQSTSRRAPAAAIVAVRQSASPRAASQGDSMSAERDFDQAVTEKVAAGMNRTDAIRAVVRERPKLHRRYLKEANADRPQAHIR